MAGRAVPRGARARRAHPARSPDRFGGDDRAGRRLPARRGPRRPPAGAARLRARDVGARHADRPRSATRCCERSGSAATLAALAGSNLLLVRARPHRRAVPLSPPVRRDAARGAAPARARRSSASCTGARARGTSGPATRTARSTTRSAPATSRRRRARLELGRGGDRSRAPGDASSAGSAASPTRRSPPTRRSRSRRPTAQLAARPGRPGEYWTRPPRRPRTAAAAVQAGVALMRAALARDGIARMARGRRRAPTRSSRRTARGGRCAACSPAPRTWSPGAATRRSGSSRRARAARPSRRPTCTRSAWPSSRCWRSTQEDWEEAAGLDRAGARAGRPSRARRLRRRSRSCSPSRRSCAPTAGASRTRRATSRPRCACRRR